MKSVNYKFLTLALSGLLTLLGWAQPPVRSAIRGYFLTDSIEIGRPFRYALTYRHAPSVDVLFPDTAAHFLPYQVQKVDVYATQTTGAGTTAISRDSAVYTLVSFETDTAQQLRVPVRIIHDVDCTAQWTQVDTVFLRSKLPPARYDSTGSAPLTLATKTELAPLKQQFNYAVLVKGVLLISVVSALLYGLFGRIIRRQWRLYQLNRRHISFLRSYNQLSQRLTSFTASEVANQAVVMWKVYLEKLDRQPYVSLTTPELAERINNERVTEALREADRMIYGGTFSPSSLSALHELRAMAVQAYHRSRNRLQGSAKPETENLEQPDSAETSSFS